MTTKIKSGLIADNAIVSAHISSGAISSAHLSSIDTDNVSEGSSNLYFTTARARTSLSVTDSGGDGSLAYDNSTGAITYTGPSAAEVRAHFSAGTNTTYSTGQFSISDSTIRSKFSVTDSGGDGSLSYSNGVITYTGPSASEVQAHLSAGTGVTYSSGAISIGQSVATTASPTFADINITGNINVTGDLNTVSVTDLDVTDQTITLGAGQNEASSGGSGIVVDGSGASLLWDESNDEFDFNKGINVTGAINSTGTDRAIQVNGTTRINSVGDIIGTSYYVGSNAIVDTNSNLTNIGTIGSTAINTSSSGTIFSGFAKSASFYEVLNAGSTTASATSPRFYSPASGTAAFSAGGAERLRLSSSGATFTGTISSGNISSSGSITANSSMNIIGATGSSGFMYIYDRDNGTNVANGFLIQKSGANAYVRNRDSVGKLFLGAGDDPDYLAIYSNGDYYAGTTKWFDQSRNLTNIGAITMGAAALTLNGSLGTWSVNSEGARMSFGRGSANYIDAVHESGYLIFQTSNGETALTLDTSQNATFAGTISSGALTATEVNISNGDLNFTKVDGIGINAKESLAITIDSDNNDSSRVFSILDGSGSTLMQVTDTGNATFLGNISAELVTSVGGVVNTNTGSNPFYITRQGATNQALKIYTDDAGAVFESIQDESADNYGNFIFAMDGGTTEPFFDVRKGTASSGSKFRVDGSGNVGIGNDAPLGKLHVRDGSAQSGISHTYIYDASAISIEATEPSLQLMAEDSGTHGGSLLWRYGNNSFAAIANPTTDAIDFTYGVSTANDFQVHSGTNMSSYKKIMSIGGDGKVGIGTDSPNDILDIRKANSQLRLTDSDDSKFVQFSYSGGKLVTRNNSTSTETAQVTLIENGNFGIGTLNPEQKLHVEGRGVFDGAASSDILQIRNDSGGGVFGNSTNQFSLDLSSTSTFRVRQGSSVPFYLSASGNLHLQSASQNRIVLGSTGDDFAVNNTNNWIRGNSGSLEFNAASSGYTWECTGTPRLAMSSTGVITQTTAGTSDSYDMFLRSTDGGDPGLAIVRDNTVGFGIAVRAAGNDYADLQLNTSGQPGYTEEGKIRIRGDNVTGLHGKVYVGEAENNTVDPEAVLHIRGSTMLESKVANIGLGTHTPHFTVGESGELEFMHQFVGTFSTNDTVVFTYEATAWKSWYFEVKIASTDGFYIGRAGGYNNNGGPTHNSEQGDTSIASITPSYSGQHVIVTIALDGQVHPMMKFKFACGGGEGHPKASRCKLVVNS